MVEGAGAVGIAALLAGRIRTDGPVVLLLSGGNIDMGLHTPDRPATRRDRMAGGMSRNDHSDRSRPARAGAARPRRTSPASKTAFQALATRSVAMPPILRLDIPEHNGEVDVKTAYVPGPDGLRDQDQPRLLRQSEARPARAPTA